MSVFAAFEIRITTLETRSILRAATEREAATKAETLIRRIHERGEAVAFRVTGAEAAATRRLTHYLEAVLAEAEPPASVPRVGGRSLIRR
ncbi:hypothetical protein OPKNFCMD_5813 [Methylobacterium crusticola]|uniref:Uncharacterized protein n=1 Tax=Methylobacterium crusticola TaxID=1697972 RepID=A0ABQ4R5W5_9HYPH|nr:hypothetical protein [Methylobacterium crusticola]GJD53043.1 hypothetical protein OPKNFCMD_5813 [Methylobacterium crusticola]